MNGLMPSSTICTAESFAVDFWRQTFWSSRPSRVVDTDQRTKEPISVVIDSSFGLVNGLVVVDRSVDDLNPNKRSNLPNIMRMLVCRSLTI